MLGAGARAFPDLRDRRLRRLPWRASSAQSAKLFRARDWTKATMTGGDHLAVPELRARRADSAPSQEPEVALWRNWSTQGRDSLRVRPPWFNRQHIWEPALAAPARAAGQRRRWLSRCTQKKRAILMRPGDLDARGWNYVPRPLREKKGGGGGSGGGAEWKRRQVARSEAQQSPQPQGLSSANSRPIQLLGSAAREERDVQAKKMQQNRVEPPPGGKRLVIVGFKVAMSQLAIVATPAFPSNHEATLFSLPCCCCRSPRTPRGRPRFGCACFTGFSASALPRAGNAAAMHERVFGRTT